MNRKEAIEALKGFRKNDFEYPRDWEFLNSLVGVLGQPITLAEFLGWEEEEVEYEYKCTTCKIENNKLLYKNNECSSGWCNLFIYGDDIEELQQAKKVEKKQKAYHVKDEYSYNELMKELEEQGYMWGFYKKATELDAWRDYEEEIIIYCTNEKKLRFSDLAYYKDKEKDDYDLVEYHKEESKFYARYKGSINLYQDYNYYNYLAWKGVCVISDKGEVFDSIIQMTKTEWNKLGINGSNADFEEVE
ncbi:hypothetical protein ACKA04_02455 [Helcococcus kunzii]|uniref:hypothetical protein n=1 Tax=Helcococcus kunzii TaxID=40091 RepID=UPI0038A92803